jgi:hypothetical protein
MPRVGLPQPLTTAPPRVGSTCVYLSLSALGVKLDRLHGRPRGEPSRCGIAEAFVDTWPIL